MRSEMLLSRPVFVICADIVDVEEWGEDGGMGKGEGEGGGIGGELYIAFCGQSPALTWLNVTSGGAICSNSFCNSGFPGIPHLFSGLKNYYMGPLSVRASAGSCRSAADGKPYVIERPPFITLIVLSFSVTKKGHEVHRLHPNANTSQPAL
jgi:hypothetical protein